MVFFLSCISHFLGMGTLRMGLNVEVTMKLLQKAYEPEIKLNKFD